MPVSVTEKATTAGALLDRHGGPLFRWRGGPARVMLGGMADVTRILNAIEAGEPTAAAELLPLVYDELRKLAAAWLRNENPKHGGGHHALLSP